MKASKKEEGSKVVSFSFREKDKGWHETGLRLQMGPRIKLANGKEITRNPALLDSYINCFLEDMIFRPSCYQCSFKGIPKQTADITIADFWGVGGVLPEMNDGRVTSLLLIHDERGQRLFDEIKDGFDYRECAWKAAMEKNPFLVQSVTEPEQRRAFFEDLETAVTTGQSGVMCPFPGSLRKSCLP